MSDQQGDDQLPDGGASPEQQQAAAEPPPEAESEEPVAARDDEPPPAPEEEVQEDSPEGKTSPEAAEGDTPPSPDPEPKLAEDGKEASPVEQATPEATPEVEQPGESQATKPDDDVTTAEQVAEDAAKTPVVEDQQPPEDQEEAAGGEEPKAEEDWVVVEALPQQDSHPEPSEVEGVVAETNGKVEVVTGEDEGAVTVEFEVGVEEPKEPQRRSLTPGDDTKIGEYLRQLQIGLDLVKIKKSKWYPRIYRLDDDLLSVSWNSRSKKGARAKFSIAQIKEVRTGRSTDSFKLSSSTHPENLCFSIVYLNNAAYKTLDLAALSELERSACVEALQALMADTKGEHKSIVQERWLRDMFQEADRNGDQTLDVKEVLRMMKTLNVGMSSKILKQKFKAADKDGDYDGKLNFDEFSSLFRELAGRPELQRLFSLVSSRLDWLSASDLQKFLQLEQGESPSMEDCQRMVQKYEPTDAGKAKGFLSIDGFTQFLLGNESNIFNCKHREVYQDMTQPLSHYFIASSHNTYLMEDQLKGPSSTEAYIRALRKGCRCVELDCWDGENGEPVIYHGHTLTSKILFRDAIKAIDEHAFVTSQFPVILSIENHCSVPQQNKMAEIMAEVFQDTLYKDTRDEAARLLPSPGELKGKILIKGKKLSHELEGAEEDDGDVSDEDEAADIEAQHLKKEDTPKPVEEEPKKEAAEAGTEQPAEGEEPKTEGTAAKSDEEPAKAEKTEGEKLESPTKQRPTRSFSFRSRQKKQAAAAAPSQPAKKIKLSRSLSACINYVQSVHFKSFAELDSALCYHMSSFGESSAFKISGNDPHKFVQYNRRQISRIYPGGARVNSTNYNPVAMWNCGSQIVALNYQTASSAMDFNDGKFMQNGGSGYVLKPTIMTEELSYFDHRQKLSRSGAKLITIKVVSGQQLPKPGNKDGEIIDPYVCIKITGTPEDTQLFKTKVVQDNGFNPVWNETIQAVVKFPELALLRFKVMDRDLNQDDFIGQFTLPFDSIMPGYRHIHLLRNGGNKIEGCSLFVHITIQDYIGTARHIPLQRKLKSTVKVKRHREYPDVHPVGQVEVVEQLRAGGVLVHRAIDLREDFLFSLLHFKESCGSAPQAGVTDCMQLFAARVKGRGISVLLHSLGEDPKVYKVVMEAEGDVPESVQHIMEAFDLLNHSIQLLLTEAPKVMTELAAVYSKAKEYHDNLKEYLKQNSPKTFEKAMEHYYSAMFTFAAEERQLKEAQETGSAVLAKLNESAVAVGFEVKTQL